MFIGELFNEITVIDIKIDKLIDYIFYLTEDSKVDRAKEIKKYVDDIFQLINRKQAKQIFINRVGQSVEVLIGDSRSCLADVIEIRDSVNYKIDILNKLIEYYQNGCKQTDIESLIGTRDTLYDESETLDNIIDSHIWKIRISEREEVGKVETEESDTNDS
jgi:hypothetical protein